LLDHIFSEYDDNRQTWMEQYLEPVWFSSYASLHNRVHLDC
jgi:hypothetical protein